MVFQPAPAARCRREAPLRLDGREQHAGRLHRRGGDHEERVLRGGQELLPARQGGEARLRRRDGAAVDICRGKPIVSRVFARCRSVRIQHPLSAVVAPLPLVDKSPNLLRSQVKAKSFRRAVAGANRRCPAT